MGTNVFAAALRFDVRKVAEEGCPIVGAELLRLQKSCPHSDPFNRDAPVWGAKTSESAWILNSMELIDTIKTADKMISSKSLFFLFSKKKRLR